MLSTAFQESKLRLLIGLGVVGVAVVSLAGRGQPIWHAVLLALLAPWLVLGRDARRIERGVREGIRLAPNGGRWVLAELVPALVFLAIAALIMARGAPIVALSVFVWAAALVTVADALDRRGSRAGAAWVALLVPAVALLTAPLWLAGWFSAPGLSHWPASLSVAVHPAGMAVAAGGDAALQDPVFYRWTLSGVVEARPLGWWVGALVYTGIAVGGALGARRAARRPARVLMGVVDAHHPVT